MNIERPNLLRPGLFGVEAAADNRRHIFDLHNESLLARSVPVDVVFLGDSITDMWALDVYFRGRSGFLVNRGISGDRTPFLQRRFAADALQLRPKMVVLLIGVNNTWDLDEWDPYQRRTPDEIEREIVTDIRAMVQEAKNATVPIVVCSILPTDVPFNGNTRVRNEIIVRANTQIRRIAADAEAQYVDYHTHMVADDGLTLRPGLADDGLHPHSLGYEIMARVLLDTLEASGSPPLIAHRLPPAPDAAGPG